MPSVMWKLLTSGVIGDARRADSDKGEGLIAACRDGVAAVLRNPQTWS